MKPFNPARKGKPVESVVELFALADAKRSVIIPSQGNRPQPAAFIENYNARRLHHLIERGAIYEYIPQHKETQTNGE